MRATVLYGAGDVRVETVPDARLIEPTDAGVRVTRAAICGSDLWPYRAMPHSDTGRRIGHEFIGVVADVGADVRTLKAGDVVVSPFLISDGTCVFCREGLTSACFHGGRFGYDGVEGGQGEAVRVPQADGTLVRGKFLEGRIEPGRVFDRVTNLDGVREGYRAMNDREAIKVMIEL
jgi:threonine dehydrogenase-like Zn-dependent dehydrogenase